MRQHFGHRDQFAGYGAQGGLREGRDSEGPLLPALSWLILISLLLALVIGAATFDPGRWPGVVGDEASYLMAAQSLAWDFDLRYEVGDLERFEAVFGRKPEGLILQSPDGGAKLLYGKPLLYPAYLAPWVRLWPRRGPSIANALLLALASILAARALRPVLGGAAPLWLAAFVFASVSFVYVYWVHSDLFLMSLVAIALSLVTLKRGERRSELFRRQRWRWLPWTVAGLLLAVVSLSRPFYAPLLLPVAVAALPARRLRAVAVGFAATTVTGLLLTLAVQGTWTPYAGERQGYYSHTGFPYEGGTTPSTTVDDWQERLRAGGDNAWVGTQLFPFGFDAKVLSWNAVYGLFGRHVGLAPYFLPFLLGLIAFRSDGFRWSLVLAALVVCGLFFVTRPFNFWGGGGAIANRYLLPIYPVAWFLIGRFRSLVWPLVIGLLAAITLWPTWTEPRGFLRREDGSYRHVSRFAERWLPYETTQSHLKPAGREDFRHGHPHPSPNGADDSSSFWIKPLSPRIDEREGWISLSPGDHGAQLLFGSVVPTGAVMFVEGVEEAMSSQLEPGRPSSESGAGPDETGSTSSGAIPVRSQQPARVDGRTIRLDPLQTRARHRMWWSRDLFYLYQVDLDRQLADWQPPAESVGVRAPLWFRIEAIE